MRLKRSFFDSDTNKVARELLGKKIVRVFDDGTKIEAIITETEAYHGFEDKASHASRKKTERNKVMFEKAGLVYVYLIYGMHYCLNFTTMPGGYPAAVLIRSIVVNNSKGKGQKSKIQFKSLKVESLKNSLRTENCEIENFAPINGPGRVTKFLGIDKTFYGENLFKNNMMWLEDGLKVKKSDIISSKRIGVDYAEESKDWEWNYKIRIKNDK